MINSRLFSTTTRIPFPAFTGQRVYMQEFTKEVGLPENLLQYSDTVDAMLDGVNAPGAIFLMVDQTVVSAGQLHRRGGAHIDGCWNPCISAHGPVPVPGHSHFPVSPPATKRAPVPAKKKDDEAEWDRLMNNTAAAGYFMDGGVLVPGETLLLASNALGCVGYEGVFDGDARGGGDCSHLELDPAGAIDFEPGHVFGGNAMNMLHESIPLKRDCRRIVVRLNVRGRVN